MVTGAERWNHNIYYHRVIFRALPTGAQRVLDVGCGEGTLARKLRKVVPRVTAIDLDPASVELARQHDGAEDIDYVHGDFLTHPLEPASYDAVVSVAALHHMEAAAALGRMRELLRPSGTLVVVGCARRQLPRDLPVELAGAVATRLHKLTRTYWEHPSPTVWPPPQTYSEARLLAAQVLPGVRYRRHVLWRYSLTWTNAAAATNDRGRR